MLTMQVHKANLFQDKKIHKSGRTNQMICFQTNQFNQFKFRKIKYNFSMSIKKMKQIM